MVNNLEDVLEHAETIVIGNSGPEFKNILNRINDNQAVIDFVRISDLAGNTKYSGICW